MNRTASRTYTAVSLALGLALIVGLLAFASSASAASYPAASTASERCYEDEPCFNWATMGNERRGVVTLDGTFKVVGVCGFNRLWAHGAIRYRIGQHKLLDRLKGDKLARTVTDCPWRTREHKPFPWAQTPGDWAVQHGY